MIQALCELGSIASHRVVTLGCMQAKRLLAKKKAPSKKAAGGSAAAAAAAAKEAKERAKKKGKSKDSSHYNQVSPSFVCLLRPCMVHWVVCCGSRWSNE